MAYGRRRATRSYAPRRRTTTRRRAAYSSRPVRRRVSARRTGRSRSSGSRQQTLRLVIQTTAAPQAAPAQNPFITQPEVNKKKTAKIGSGS